jgi:hypothetical protein
VHYDSDAQRRPLLRRLVAEGTLPRGYAADEAVGLHYVGTEFVQAVSYVEGQGAYELMPGEDGEVKEIRVEPRLLASF